MAGEGIWLKVAAGLPHSDGAGILERRLEVDRAWSYALSTWDWFVAKHPEGQVVGPDAAFLISRGAGWQGEPDKFCAAMVAASYLAVIPEGFRVRGWKEWAGFHLNKQVRDAERKRKSRGDPADVTVTSRGQATENKAPDGPCPCDPSPLSSVSVVASEGVQGEAAPAPRKRARLVSPLGAADPDPEITAVLAALYERGIDAAPPSPASAPRVKAAIIAAGIPVATDRLAAVLPGSDKKPLTYHVAAIRGEAAKPDTQGRPDPSKQDYSTIPEL